MLNLTFASLFLSSHYGSPFIATRTDTLFRNSIISRGFQSFVYARSGRIKADHVRISRFRSTAIRMEDSSAKCTFNKDRFAQRADLRIDVCESVAAVDCVFISCVSENKENHGGAIGNSNIAGTVSTSYCVFLYCQTICEGAGGGAVYARSKGSMISSCAEGCYARGSGQSFCVMGVGTVEQCWACLSPEDSKNTESTGSVYIMKTPTVKMCNISKNSCGKTAGLDIFGYGDTFIVNEVIFFNNSGVQVMRCISPATYPEASFERLLFVDNYVRYCVVAYQVMNIMSSSFTQQNSLVRPLNTTGTPFSMVGSARVTLTNCYTDFSSDELAGVTVTGTLTESINIEIEKLSECLVDLPTSEVVPSVTEEVIPEANGGMSLELIIAIIIAIIFFILCIILLILLVIFIRKSKKREEQEQGGALGVPVQNPEEEELDELADGYVIADEADKKQEELDRQSREATSAAEGGGVVAAAGGPQRRRKKRRNVTGDTATETGEQPAHVSSPPASPTRTPSVRDSPSGSTNARSPGTSQSDSMNRTGSPRGPRGNNGSRPKQPGSPVVNRGRHGEPAASPVRRTRGNGTDTSASASQRSDMSGHTSQRGRGPRAPPPKATLGFSDSDSDY